MPSMRTTISLPEYLYDEVINWNIENPDDTINVSGISRKALRNALNEKRKAKK